MKQYKYSAKNSSGQLIRGDLPAETESEAIKKLREKGLIVLHLSASNSSPFSKGKHGMSFGKHVSDKDKIVFTQQLAIMSKAGLPITQALQSLKDETTNKTLVEIVNTIAQDVEGGISLSDAFKKHQEVFGSVYVSILKAGEKSGKVDEVLTRLSAQLNKDYEIKSKVKGALSYPIFVLTAMAIIVTLIMVYIIPQIQSVFTENDAKLPLLTQIVITISGIMRHQFLLIIGSIIVLIEGYRLYYRTAKGKYAIDLLKLKLPIFGTLFKRVSIARFARIFSTLLSAGIPMLEIFDTCKDVVGNEIFRQELDKVSKDVENGLGISAALKKQPHIPPMVVQLTAVGEKSGNIDVIYNNLAEFMEQEVDNITRNLTTLLEPALMLIMGVVIGTIVISVLLPIYTLTTNVL